MPHVVICLQCGSRQHRWSRRPPSFCLDCANERYRENASACSKVAAAVRKGQLPPARSLVCTDCSKAATEYDHRDYTKPLEVQPVCRSCNHKRPPAFSSGYRPPQSPAPTCIRATPAAGHVSSLCDGAVSGPLVKLDGGLFFPNKTTR